MIAKTFRTTLLYPEHVQTVIRYLLFGIVTVIFLGFTAISHAADFSTSADVSYQLDPSGQTHVLYDLRLRNERATVYAQEYVLIVQANDLTNILASDVNGKSLPLQVRNDNQQTIITVGFDKQRLAIGREQEQLFRIGFSTKQLMDSLGEATEFSVPKLSDADLFSQYSVRVIAPEKWGEPSFISPREHTRDVTGAEQLIRFTNTARESGVRIIFGQQQTYKVTMTYTLQPTGSNVALAELPLPPDTPWQRVRLTSLSPQPDKIARDEDGNWIGQFRLSGGTSHSISIEALVTRLANANHSVPGPRDQKFNNWLLANTWWPALPEKKGLTPRQIYLSAIQTLTYNPLRIQSGSTNRLGATAALADPSNALCQEYTDLTIAWLRSAGIPARRAIGTAVSNNPDYRPLSLQGQLLHTWPEYADLENNRWTPIDPTWADTTGGVDYFSNLGLRHITFVWQGIKADSPLPPSQSISVEPLPNTPPGLLEDGVTTDQISVQLKGQALFLTNKSNQALTQIAYGLIVKGSQKLNSPAQGTIAFWLPFETIELPVNTTGQWWRSQSASQLELLLGDQKYEFQLTSLTNQPTTWVVGGAVLLGTTIAGGLLVWQGKQRSLHR